jgi:hypothetical protein
MLGVDPWDVEENIKGGVKYYKDMRDKFNDPVKAATAYHSGPGAVESGKLGPRGRQYRSNFAAALSRMGGDGEGLMDIPGFSQDGLIDIPGFGQEKQTPLIPTLEQAQRTKERVLGPSTLLSPGPTEEELSKAAEKVRMPVGELISRGIRSFSNALLDPSKGTFKLAGVPTIEQIQKSGKIKQVDQAELGPPVEYGEFGKLVQQAMEPWFKTDVREPERQYAGESTMMIPAEVAGTVGSYVLPGKYVQIASSGTGLLSRLYRNLLTFAAADIPRGYQQAGMEGVKQALWHSPLTALLFTIGGLPRGRLTSTLGVGTAGTVSAAAAGERDPAKLAESFATMAVLHNLIGHFPKDSKAATEKAKAELDNWVKDNQVSPEELSAVRERLAKIRADMPDVLGERPFEETAKVTEEGGVIPMGAGFIPIPKGVSKEDYFRGIKFNVAQRERVSPDSLEYVGDMEGFGKTPGLHLFNVTDPNHPKFNSTVSWKPEAVGSVTLQPAAPEGEDTTFGMGLFPIWKSKMQESLERKLPERGIAKTVSDLVKTWAGRGEFKQEEMKWSGVIPWLEEKSGRVTKQEVMDFLRENQIEVREIEKGKPKPITELPAGYKVIETPEGYWDVYNPGGRVLTRGDSRNQAVNQALGHPDLAGLETAGTKFSQYQLPGGENYRELLLTLPAKELRRKSNVVGEYRSSHWDEPNVLAHVRFNERTGPNGERILFIEEIQSDWHQKGRREGYRQEPLTELPEGYKVYKRGGGIKYWAVRDKEGNIISETPDFPPSATKGFPDEYAIKEALKVINEERLSGIPPAPFSSTWHELAMKRMLRYAAENGYDKVGWTTGKQQFERWGSERIDWRRNSDDSWTVAAKEQEGGFAGGLDIEAEARNRGILLEESGRKVTSKDELRDIAKEVLSRERRREDVDKLVDRIWDRMQTEAEGTSLPRKEGLEEFYDSKSSKGGLVTSMNKYGKQWGARVGEDVITTIPKGGKEGEYYIERDGDVYHVIRPDGTWDREFTSFYDASDYMRKISPGVIQKIHSIDITPSMKQSVSEGQYMFMGLLPGMENLFQPKRPQSEAEQKIWSRISIGQHEKEPWVSGSDVYTALLDRFHPLKKLMESYEYRPESITDDPYRQTRLFEGWHGKAEAFLQHHPFDRTTYQFLKDVKPLRQILEPIFESDRLDSFRNYLVAKRVIERESKGFKTGVDLDAARETVDQLKPEFESAAVDFERYMDSVLRYTRDSGLISSERYDMIKKGSTDYAPLLRLMEPESLPGGGRGFEASEVIKKFKGSERSIIDPIEAALRLTYTMINAAERNNVGLSLIRWARQSGALGDKIREVNKGSVPIDVSLNEVTHNPRVREILRENGLSPEDAVIFRPRSFRPASDVISVWEDGTRKFFKVPKDIADVIKGMDNESINIWVRMFSAPAQALRLGATTLSPEFGIRNFFKDQFPAFFHSKYGYKPLIDFMRGVVELARGGERYWQYMISGAPSSELVSMDRRMLQSKLQDVMSGKLSMPGFLVRHPIEAAKILSEYSERGTRLGEFQKGVVQEGATPEGIQEAGFQSREITVDFGRKGSAGKAINMLTAFWNANLQGLNKFVRAHKDNPANVMAKAAAAVTIPSILLELAFGDDDRYRNLPGWRKDLFYNIPTDYGVISLPKPWTYGLVYGALPQRIVRMIKQNDPHAFDHVMEAVGREVPDFPLPTAINPFIEVWANRKLYSDRPIMPAWKKDLPPKFQFSPNTSEAAKAVGDIVSKMPLVGDTSAASPAAIEHFVKSWTGGAGKMILDGLDYSMETAGVSGRSVRPTRQLGDIPVVRALMARYPTPDAEPIQLLRENAKNFGAKLKGLNEMSQRLAVQGKSDELRQLIKELGPEASMNIKGVVQAIDNASRFVNLVDAHPGMTADRKREVIDKIYLNMIDTASRVNQAIDTMKKYQSTRGNVNQFPR